VLVRSQYFCTFTNHQNTKVCVEQAKEVIGIADNVTSLESISIQKLNSEVKRHTHRMMFRANSVDLEYDFKTRKQKAVFNEPTSFRV